MNSAACSAFAYSSGCLMTSTAVFISSRIPTIDADIRFAMVPAIMARKPSFARSPRRFGASALMPPI